MLAERMAEWRQKELEEPDEEKKLLIPGPKQAEKLELKASDAYDLRRQHLYAKFRATLEEANVQQLGMCNASIHLDVSLTLTMNVQEKALGCSSMMLPKVVKEPSAVSVTSGVCFDVAN